MSNRLNPYVNFKGNARQAMEFYKSVFGGELTMSTFGEFGASVNPDEKDLIMHAQLEAPNGYWLMGSDTPAHMDYKPGSNYSISLSGDDEAVLSGHWKKLSEGANILQALEKAPWGDSFGMLVDKFGTTWLVNIAAKR
ncbi:MAG: VOC family protein [Devosia sp.]